MHKPDQSLLYQKNKCSPLSGPKRYSRTVYINDQSELLSGKIDLPHKLVNLVGKLRKEHHEKSPEVICEMVKGRFRQLFKRNKEVPSKISWSWLSDPEKWSQHLDVTNVVTEQYNAVGRIKSYTTHAILHASRKEKLIRRKSSIRFLRTMGYSNRQAKKLVMRTNPSQEARNRFLSFAHQHAEFGGEAVSITLTLKNPECRKNPLRGYDSLLNQKNHLIDVLRKSDSTGECGYYFELQKSGALHMHCVWFPTVSADDADLEIKRFRTNRSLTVCQLTHQVFKNPSGVMHAAIYASKGGSKSTVSEKEEALFSQLSKRRYFVPVTAAKFMGFVGSALKCSFELLKEWRKNKGAPSQPASCLDSGNEIENLMPTAPRSGEGANASSRQGGRFFKSAIVSVIRCLHDKCMSVVRAVTALFAQYFCLPLFISMLGQAMRQSFLVFSWGEGIVWLPQPRAPPGGGG